MKNQNIKNRALSWQSVKNILKKIPIHPSFVLLFLWFVISNNILSFLMFTLVVLTHEFGHYFVAKKCGYKLDYFYIAPYGVSLNYKEKSFENHDEILIALAGPCVNFALSVFFVSLWWIFPITYSVSVNFVYQSILLGLFNLLPCYPLDGGRVVCGILSKQMPRKKAIKIVCILNYVFSITLALIFVYSCFSNFNPTLLLSAVFLFLGNLDIKNEGKYFPLTITNKKIKNFSRPIFIYSNGQVLLSNLIKHIEINKFTIFVISLENGKTKILDENMAKSLALKFSPAISVNEIFIKDKE